MPGTKRLHLFSKTTLRVLANMGCAEVTHSSLCDAVDAIIEHGNQRRGELELIHRFFVKLYLICSRHAGNVLHCYFVKLAYLYAVAQRHISNYNV